MTQYIKSVDPERGVITIGTRFDSATEAMWKRPYPRPRLDQWGFLRRWQRARQTVGLRRTLRASFVGIDRSVGEPVPWRTTPGPDPVEAIAAAIASLRGTP